MLIGVSWMIQEIDSLRSAGPHCFYIWRQKRMAESSTGSAGPACKSLCKIAGLDKTRILAMPPPRNALVERNLNLE
jgi:hypothetical protein